MRAFRTRPITVAKSGKRPLLRLADQFRLLGSAEADIRLRVERELVVRKLQADRDDEWRFVKTNLGGEFVVRPGGGGRGGLLDENPPRRLPINPFATATRNPLFHSGDSRYERVRAARRVSLESNGFKLEIVHGECVLFT